MDVKGNVSGSLNERLRASGLKSAWINASGRQALAINDSSIGLFRPDGSQVEPWSNVAALVDVTGTKVRIELIDESPSFEFLFVSRADRRQFVESLPGEERERIVHAPRDIGAANGMPAGAPRVAHAGSPDAVQTLWTVFWAGVVLQFVGGVMLGLAWPSVAVDMLTGEATTSGGGVGLALGWLVVSTGTMTAFVALIGFGVRLGIRAAEEDGQR